MCNLTLRKRLAMRENERGFSGDHFWYSDWRAKLYLKKVLIPGKLFGKQHIEISWFPNIYWEVFENLYMRKRWRNKNATKLRENSQNTANKRRVQAHLTVRFYLSGLFYLTDKDAYLSICEHHRDSNYIFSLI